MTRQLRIPNENPTMISHKQKLTCQQAISKGHKKLSEVVLQIHNSCQETKYDLFSRVDIRVASFHYIIPSKFQIESYYKSLNQSY